MSSYSCSYAECVTKKNKSNDETFVPFRVLVCGHSICDLCILQLCQKQKYFVKCTICSFNTTITETVQRNVIQYETEIKRWLDPHPISAPLVLSFDTSLFPLDFYQIGNGVYSGVLTAQKTTEMIDLDLDDESPTVPQKLVTSSAINSLFEDDAIVKNVVSRIPRTAPEKFRQSVENGIKSFIDLSQNHTSIKRSSDETNEWFKKLRTNTREMFHKMHSILQNRERELMEEINGIEENRLQELRVFMNEILSTRSELKGKLLQSPQLQIDTDRAVLKRAIDRIIKDSNPISIQSPQKEFKFNYENSIEGHLKKFGKVERFLPPIAETGDQQVNGIAEETNGKSNDKSSEMPIELSDEEDEDIETTDSSVDHQKIDKEVVTILEIISPFKFYVQKVSDRERFDALNEEINNICCSPYYHSPAWDTLKQGDHIFAYSLQKRCWCRATLTLIRNEVNHSREPIYIADIVLIDYGISESVQWYNIREKKVELFDPKKWPSFAYKCCLYGIKPNRKTGQNWDKPAIDLFTKYVNNNQLVLIDLGSKDGYKFVDLIHYDVPDVTYPIPSVIEVLFKNEMATLTDNINFSSYSRYKCQPLKYPLPEIPPLLKTISVLVQQVETPDLFYVQLQRQHQIWLKLIDDLNETYTDENAGIYTYYCPIMKTPCAALYDGDNKFYRAVITQKGRYNTEVIVQFVDFGNKQTVQNRDLRLLKDSFVNMPIQAIPCGLIHVDPAVGYKWTEKATEEFRIAISNDRGPQILTMCVYETKQFSENLPKLSVVLRSYDGDNGIKINELMVKRKLALSTGCHSQPDFERNLMLSSQESLNSMSSETQSTPSSKAALPVKVSAFIVLRDIMERSQSSHADKRSSLIKVNVSAVNNPSEFFVQIDRLEVKDYFDNQEKELHKTYSLEKFSGEIQFQEKEWCAFQFKDSWRRGQVVDRIVELSDTAPEEPRYRIIDLDYGSEKEVKVSLMRRLSDNFKKDGAFALKCKLHSLRPTGGDHWSHSAKDAFNDFVKNYKELLILVKGSVETEPISVILYSRQTIVPGAFIQQKIVYESINSQFIDKGLATYDRSESLGNGNESDDDKEINEVVPRELKTQMPFSLFASTESVLGSLQKRLAGDTHYQIGQRFKYLTEVYPEKDKFEGIPTDLVVTPKEYNISFRLWYDNYINQPAQVIEKNIQDVLNEKGELEPFDGTSTTGCACTAYFDFDKTWNRAEIIGVTQSDGGLDNKLRVRFVDYGNQESMIVDKLSSEVFGRETPKLALKCQLINIKPLNEEADVVIKNLIYTRVLDHKCRFLWENFPKVPMKVTVQISEGDQYVPFIEFLERQQLLAVRSEDNECVDDILNITPIVDKIYGLYPNIFQMDRFYEVVLSYFIGANYAFFQALELRNTKNQEVVINNEHDQFITMLDQLRGEIDNFSLLGPNFREGYQCVAKYVDDSWYRGLIVSVDDSERTAQVFFIDYGNTDEISYENLRELPRRFLKPRAHSFLCQIDNIKPVKEQSWSRCGDLVDKLNHRLTDVSAEERLYARFKSLTPPLKIDLYRCDPNDQTLPGKHVFQDFVDRGFLEFCDPRDVWRKPIETTHSYKSLKSLYANVKREKIDD